MSFFTIDAREMEKDLLRLYSRVSIQKRVLRVNENGRFSGKLNAFHNPHGDIIRNRLRRYKFYICWLDLPVSLRLPECSRSAGS
jgi:hypothetical protein